MRAPSRRALHPRDRRTAHPRHPVGPVRRRWPRAYDGAGERIVAERYRDSFQHDDRRERRRSDRRRGGLDMLRNNPVRNGLIGLAVAGTAAPIAVNRYQQALRTDPAHERSSVITAATPTARTSDSTVSRAWNAMASEKAATESARESVIQQKMREYAAYDLDRGLAEGIYDMAQQAEIDPEIAFGLVRAESGFKNTATSHVGAIGLTQLMPRSAAWLEPGTTRSDLRDPQTNLRIGFHYLRQLLDKYEGDLDLALTAYNRGPGTVDRVLKRGGNPDNGYAGLVQQGR
jgi:soluble lytic murein transglycosylase-like protein